MAASLATAADVVALLGRALTSEESARADAVLAKASSLFRHKARQEWEAGRVTVRLKSNGGQVRLAQRSVTAVDSVVDDDGASVEYELRGQWLDTLLPSDQFVTVDYSYDGAVPDLVREAVADIARVVITLDPAAVAGASQSSETAGPFKRSVTYASWAQGGQTGLSPDDEALALSFRPVVPRVHVMSAPAELG